MTHMPDGSTFANERETAASANVEVEQALLGAILLNNEALDAVPWLEADHFYDPIHRDLFASMRAKAGHGRRIDYRLLADEFRSAKVREGMNGAEYLARLASSATNVLNARDFGLGVLESYAIRQGVRAATELQTRLLTKRSDETIGEIVAMMEDELAKLRALSPSGDTSATIDGGVDELLQELGKADYAVLAPTIPFPLPELATVLQEDGFEAGNLYGMLGASGEGKTSLTLQIVYAAIAAGHPVCLMSYDQTKRQVLQQMLSQRTGVSVSQMKRHGRNGQQAINYAEYEKCEAEGQALKGMAPLGVFQLTDQKIGAIVSIAKRWHKTLAKMARADGTPWSTPMIILDHNRKVRPEDPRADAGSKAAAVNGAGKALARQLNAVVLFLNQRNGKGNDRYVPRPIAEDMFGGEQAKEDYDSVFYIYRPERWRDEQLSVARDSKEAAMITARFLMRKTWDDPDARNPEGMAEIGTIKVRYGRAGLKEFLRFDGRHTRYVSERKAEERLL